MARASAWFVAIITPYQPQLLTLPFYFKQQSLYQILYRVISTNCEMLFVKYSVNTKYWLVSVYMYLTLVSLSECV